MRLGNPNLAVDTKAENEGKWVECPVVWWFDPSLPMRVLIRGTANQDFQAAIRSKTKDMSSTDQFKNAFEISAELVADYLLIGWENVFAEDGSPVQYSKHAANEYVNQPCREHQSLYLGNIYL